MPLAFKGIAHPPPSKSGRKHNADLSAAEIGATKMGKNGGTDLLVEHDHGSRVGKVLTSWEGPRGELRVQGIVSDHEAAETVRTGGMRGLSLGTGVTYNSEGRACMRSQDELSLCVEPRRGGCYIDEIDGKSVRSTSTFSAGESLAARP